MNEWKNQQDVTEGNSYPDIDSIQRENRRQNEKEDGRGLFAGGIVVGMCSALVILLVVYLSSHIATLLSAQNQANNSANVAENSSDVTENSAVNPNAMQKIQTLEQMIQQYFYLHEVTEEELEEGMYKGLLEALDDPYSEYYTAEELTTIMQQTEGIYYGIGAYVSLDTETSLPKISGVIEGSPAQEANLRANDLIYEVDGTSTYGLTLTEAVAMIKGEEGTQTVLTLVREGESDYLEISLTRRKVESPTVDFEMLDDKTAHIQITEFDDVTVDQFADALATAKGSGMEGLILDLRGNPGGNLDAVLEIARMMLPEGLVVYTEDKYGERVEYTCNGERELEVPMVVLVDMNSASASEILAGAIQDYEMGTLVGTTTFGKGIVQQIIPFQDGSAVKLTVSSYFTPNGRDIHGVGIEPDVLCEFDGESYYDSDGEIDNQLQKAQEVLNEMME